MLAKCCTVGMVVFFFFFCSHDDLIRPVNTFYITHEVLIESPNMNRTSALTDVLLFVCMYRSRTGRRVPCAGYEVGRGGSPAGHPRGDQSQIHAQPGRRPRQWPSFPCMHVKKKETSHHLHILTFPSHLSHLPFSLFHPCSSTLPPCLFHTVFLCVAVFLRELLKITKEKR